MPHFAKLLIVSVSLVCLLALAGPVGGAKAAWTVCPKGCDFSLIQDAIDAALNGDTIIVQAGTYRENLRVTKNLSLQGTDTAAVVVGDGAAPTILVAGSIGSPIQVSIEGFVIAGALEARPTDVGIQSHLAHISITRNVITRHESFGIYLVTGIATIRANTLTANGGAIALGSSSGPANAIIEQNLITKNRKPLPGVIGVNGSVSLLGTGGDGEIRENLIIENEGDGIDFSHGPAFFSFVRNTVAHSTGNGLTLGSSVFGRIQVEGNTFRDNKGDGLFVRGHNRVFVVNNLIFRNAKDGIRLDLSSSADLLIERNRIQEQGLWGVGALMKLCHPESPDAKETLVGLIRGQENTILDKIEPGGNRQGDVCPQSLRFLKEN